MMKAILPLALLLAWAPPPANPVDVHFEAAWNRLNLTPASPCDDAVFLRRVSLDLTGALPEPDEVRAFLKSTRKDKRTAKIDEILKSPKSADYFAHLWVQWLMGHDVEDRDLRRLALGDLVKWLRAAWEKNLPYDEFVTALLTTAGDLRENPPANFMAKHLAPDEPPAALAGRAAKLFLGIELRCAQCHDHPFEEYTHEQFWSYAAFFRGLAPGNGRLVETPVRAPGTLRDDMGEKFGEPRLPDGRGPEENEPRLKALARLTLSQKDDAAARAVVDRVWKLHFGQPLLPGRRSKGRPELLETLTTHFVRGRWSLKDLVRTIVTSRAYQLSSEGEAPARAEYAVGPLKLMNAVQFMKVWNHAFRFDLYYRKVFEKDPSRAPFFADPDVFWIAQTMSAKEMLFPKGRDPEEVLASGTDRLALKLMNNRDLQLLMVAKFQSTGDASYVWKVMRQTEDPGRRIEELFLLMVSRPPTKGEKARLVDYVKGFANPFHGNADVFWMLFNSSEFLFVG